jgi:hypothetical protein
VSGSLGPFAYSHPLQCGKTKPLNVLSISYGEEEFDLPKSYQKHQCNEFLKLGLVGTTIIVASGDSGVAVWGYDAGNISDCLGTGQVFNPDYPVTCQTDLVPQLFDCLIQFDIEDHMHTVLCASQLGEDPLNSHLNIVKESGVKCKLKT